MEHPMNRRKFLKVTASLGGGMLLSRLGMADGASAAPAAGPRVIPIARPGNIPAARIAFVKTQDRVQGVNKALDLLGINPVQGKNVFLKANFNSADPTPGSTHSDTLSALVQRLQAMGVNGITIGDRSGMGNTRQVMQQKGLFQMADELGFQTVVFDELKPEDWEWLQPQSSHWSNGFWIARPALQADGVVQTCCLKTHRYGGHFTLSLKNSVGLAAKYAPGGGYNYMNELHNSPHQRRMIAVILAGTDRVALDAVGVAILRYFGTTAEVRRGRIFEQEQIARAVELGLGVTGPDQIELITDDADSAAYAAEIGGMLEAQG
jgi:uncharacterized protein (DUF362 family)